MYFDGHLSDEKHLIRFVGFSDKLHEDLSDIHQKKEPVLLKNCNLYKGKTDREPQIFINKGRTTIHKSPTLFDVKHVQMQPTTVTLADLPTLQKYVKVNVEAKVLKIKQPIIVGQDTKKQIQKIIIADETNYTTIQLWEEDMNTLQEHTSYRFNNITTSEYYGEKYFMFSTNSSATQIEDIGSVVKPPVDDSEMPIDAPKEYDDVYIAGIAQFN